MNLSPWQAAGGDFNEGEGEKGGEMNITKRDLLENHLADELGMSEDEKRHFKSALKERRERHIHKAGTIVGLDIDTCALCGKDIRDDSHLRQTCDKTYDRRKK